MFGLGIGMIESFVDEDFDFGKSRICNCGH